MEKRVKRGFALAFIGQLLKLASFYSLFYTFFIGSILLSFASKLKKTSVSWILNALQLLSNDASKITEAVHKKRMAAN